MSNFGGLVVSSDWESREANASGVKPQPNREGKVEPSRDRAGGAAASFAARALRFALPGTLTFNNLSDDVTRVP